jgi:transposase-like protein
MGKIRTNRQYTPETKLEAVRLFLEEKKTRAQIIEILELPYTDLVKDWVHRYRTEENPFGTKPHGRKKKIPGEKETLEEEVKRLRMENDLLKKLRSESLKIMLAKRDIGQSKDTKPNIK